jgi:tetratricopeptide (TPR) repeat protein
MVNFELARIYAGKGDVTQALRYYHNAIYAIWNQDQDSVRRSARLELIDFLLAGQSHGQAESELIALEGSLPDDPDLISKVGNLFMQVPDYERALSLFLRSLRLKRQNPEALAGAGHAAFELARYKVAERYLRSAVSANPEDSGSAQLLETTRHVIQMNPYRIRISRAERTKAVKDAFDTASSRLSACVAKTSPGGVTSSPLQALNARVLQMQPRLRRRAIDSDTVDDAMSLVSDIEQRTKDSCGPPTGKDLALLLISRENQGD